jgi:hypothetical protein
MPVLVLKSRIFLKKVSSALMTFITIFFTAKGC